MNRTESGKTRKDRVDDALRAARGRRKARGRGRGRGSRARTTAASRRPKSARLLTRQPLYTWADASRARPHGPDRARCSWRGAGPRTQHHQPAPNPGKVGPELVPIPNAPALGLPAATARVAKAWTASSASGTSTVVFRIRTHLTLFVDGKPRLVPAGVGIWPALEKRPRNLRPVRAPTQGECLAWLVTRFADGILHVEAPLKRVFTLGQFFDMWGQPLGPNVARTRRTDL